MDSKTIQTSPEFPVLAIVPGRGIQSHLYSTSLSKATPSGVRHGYFRKMNIYDVNSHKWNVKAARKFDTKSNVAKIIKEVFSIKPITYELEYELAGKFNIWEMILDIKKEFGTGDEFYLEVNVDRSSVNKIANFSEAISLFNFRK